MKIIKSIFHIIVKFIEDGCSIYAAALGYLSLLALVPFSVVFFTILSFFSVFKIYIEQIEKFIFNNFVASSADIIQQYLLTFINQGIQLSIWSIIALLITVILLALNVVAIFDKIWRVEVRRKNVYLALKYFFIITLFPIVVGVLLVLSNYFYFIPFIEKLTFLFPYLIILIAFTMLYYYTPNRKIRFISSLISGFIATLFFIAAKNGFSIYIAHFSNYQALYGLFSVIPVFLVWIYICWLIILLGVEINYELEKILG